ncbi:unnamed protein product [Rodentolepis nana]|uniref:Uncharacterized protein n=1 Tax=Rodentolepis nana TaxID=102285 RepID=A0A3P7WFN0_RODNA|nr:unnamed protein product [Rodentolepis nana]
MNLGCAIDLPPRGAPWTTYLRTAKKSITRHSILTSIYYNLGGS